MTGLVYPALLAPSTEDAWTHRHARHSRAIAPVVAVVYGALAVSGLSALRNRPTRSTLVSLAASSTAMALTAIVAAPAHGRLGRGRDAQVEDRLRRADRGRLAAAVVAALSALR